ncbi:HAD-IIIA family hydrolase [Myxococcota bacterium]|nr:HAD-IIIA family hydrolase [Myxococcota bacterium]
MTVQASLQSEALAQVARARVVVFDVDGTLRYTTRPDARYPITGAEWRLMPGVPDVLGALELGGARRLAIASNQEGVGLGLVDAARARALVDAVIVAALGRVPDGTLVELCTCAPSTGCPRRKPAPGLLHAILARAGRAPSDAVLVGDQPCDAGAAAAAGVPFVWASALFSAWAGEDGALGYGPPKVPRGPRGFRGGAGSAIVGP